MTDLPQHTRGDTFRYTSPALANGYTEASFDELWFTVRDNLPTTSVEDDTDALAQATLSGGGGITWPTSTTIEIFLPASASRAWPKRVRWDLQGRLLNGEIKTIDSGEIPIAHDVTRSQ